MSRGRRLGLGEAHPSLFPPGAWKRKRERGFCRLALLTLVFSLALAGCGKKGPPEPPPGEPTTYPRTYPNE